MAEDWAQAARDIDDGMREAGQLVTFATDVDPSYDPATGDTDPGTPASPKGWGIEEAYSAFSLSSGAVEAGDVKFLLSALQDDGSPMPAPVADEWRATYTDGTVWRVKDVGRTAPGGPVVMYELRLGR